MTHCCAVRARCAASMDAMSCWAVASFLCWGGVKTVFLLRSSTTCWAFPRTFAVFVRKKVQDYRGSKNLEGRTFSRSSFLTQAHSRDRATAETGPQPAVVFPRVRPTQGDASTCKVPGDVRAGHFFCSIAFSKTLQKTFCKTNPLLSVFGRENFFKGFFFSQTHEAPHMWVGGGWVGIGFSACKCTGLGGGGGAAAFYQALVLAIYKRPPHWPTQHPRP
jgi:hypothetical protein